MSKERSIEENVNTIIDVAMQRLKEIIDVNTVIGKPVVIDNKTKIVPISKVSVGFVAGGGEIVGRKKNSPPKDPFAGGSGSGFMVTPLGFLIFEDKGIHYLDCENKTPLDEIIKFSNSILNKVVLDNKDSKNEKNN